MIMTKAQSMTNTKHVFLHVGPRRCGSTYLQNVVFPNIPGVKDMRTNPSLMGTIIGAMDENPLFFDEKSFRQDINTKVSYVEEEKVIFSDEDYFGDYGYYISDQFYVACQFHDNAHKARVLSKLFKSAKIIITPRRQDLWIESSYLHFIQNYYTFSIKQFLEPGIVWDEFVEYTKRARAPAIDFKALDWTVFIENYIDLFGRENVLVIPQEMFRHDSTQAIERLCDFMDVKPFSLAKNQVVNESLSSFALKLALIFNQFVHTARQPFGIIPSQPFLLKIQQRRKIKDSKFLWFLAGCSRRFSLHWFLIYFLGKFDSKKAKILSPKWRTTILNHYREPNRKLAKLIGLDLKKYDYY